MGYYSSYAFTILDDKIEAKENREIIRIFTKLNEGFQCAIDIDGTCSEPCKWYDYQEDMKLLSLMYPQYLFLIDREGEENGDIEKSYFKNGKSQICKVIMSFEPFDENKLID